MSLKQKDYKRRFSFFSIKTRFAANVKYEVPITSQFEIGDLEFVCDLVFVIEKANDNHRLYISRESFCAYNATGPENLLSL